MTKIVAETMLSQAHPTVFTSGDKYRLELWEIWGSESQMTAYVILIQVSTHGHWCNLIPVGTQLKAV